MQKDTDEESTFLCFLLHHLILLRNATLLPRHLVLVLILIGHVRQIPGFPLLLLIIASLTQQPSLQLRF